MLQGWGIVGTATSPITRRAREKNKDDDDNDEPESSKGMTGMKEKNMEAMGLSMGGVPTIFPHSKWSWIVIATGQSLAATLSSRPTYTLRNARTHTHREALMPSSKQNPSKMKALLTRRSSATVVDLSSRHVLNLNDWCRHCVCTSWLDLGASARSSSVDKISRC